MIENAVKEFPNFKVAATTLRTVKSATRNDWSAICWHDGKFYESNTYPDLEILDRVGGGDSFASGLAYGFFEAQRRGEGGAVWRGARGAGDDDAGGHVDGVGGRGGEGDGRRRGAGGEIGKKNSNNEIRMMK